MSFLFWVLYEALMLGLLMAYGASPGVKATLIALIVWLPLHVLQYDRRLKVAYVAARLGRVRVLWPTLGLLLNVMIMGTLVHHLWLARASQALLWAFLMLVVLAQIALTVRCLRRVVRGYIDRENTLRA